jgi:hypothetical protein
MGTVKQSSVLAGIANHCAEKCFHIRLPRAKLHPEPIMPALTCKEDAQYKARPAPRYWHCGFVPRQKDITITFGVQEI